MAAGAIIQFIGKASGGAAKGAAQAAALQKNSPSHKALLADQPKAPLIASGGTRDALSDADIISHPDRSKTRIVLPAVED